MREIKLKAYTDASSFNNGKKNPSLPEHSASAGVILMESDDSIVIIDSVYTYNPNSSISFGEIIAIYNILSRVEYLASNVDLNVSLTLHSDSAYCVQAINDWMPNWKKRQRNGIWIKSTGEPVAYQSIFEEIDRILNLDNLSIKIKHIAGHIDMSNKKHVMKAMKNYLRFNKKEVSVETLQKHTYFNDMCDVYAKEVLRLGMRGELKNEREKRNFVKYLS